MWWSVLVLMVECYLFVLSLIVLMSVCGLMLYRLRLMRFVFCLLCLLVVNDFKVFVMKWYCVMLLSVFWLVFLFWCDCLCKKFLCRIVCEGFEMFWICYFFLFLFWGGVAIFRFCSRFLSVIFFLSCWFWSLMILWLIWLFLVVNFLSCVLSLWCRVLVVEFFLIVLRLLWVMLVCWLSLICWVCSFLILVLICLMFCCRLMMGWICVWMLGFRLVVMMRVLSKFSVCLF